MMIFITTHLIMKIIAAQKKMKIIIIDSLEEDIEAEDFEVISEEEEGEEVGDIEEEEEAEEAETIEEEEEEKIEDIEEISEGKEV